MEVSLTPELERFVAAEVATGRYPTAGEVVRDALREFEEKRGNPNSVRAALDKELELRIAEADRREFVDVDQMWSDFDSLARERQAVSR